MDKHAQIPSLSLNRWGFFVSCAVSLNGQRRGLRLFRLVGKKTLMMFRLGDICFIFDVAN